jgi:hypothetical protein
MRDAACLGSRASGTGGAVRVGAVAGRRIWCACVVQGGAQEDGRDQDTEKERDDARPKGRICPEPLDDCVQLAERVGALPEDGPEATQVGGVCAEADVAVDGARTEAVNGPATALAERGDRGLDPDPGGELFLEVRLLPAFEVVPDEALPLGEDEDARAALAEWPSVGRCARHSGRSEWRDRGRS